MYLPAHLGGMFALKPTDGAGALGKGETGEEGSSDDRNSKNVGL